MKAFLLLALRATTGSLLIIWGLIKTMTPETAIKVSDKYYAGALSTDAWQAPLGYAQIALGTLVILGLFRSVAYTMQALVLIIGAGAIWKYLADPLGLYLLTEETRNVLFFPSTTVAIATLVLIAFRSDDAITLDRLIFRR